MTCLEKFKADHPDWGEEKIQATIKFHCPDTWGYLPNPSWCRGSNSRCEDCWNRELPEAYPDMVAAAQADMEKDMDEVINGLFVGDERLEHLDTDIYHYETVQLSRDDVTKLLETVDKAIDDKPRILDSGNRRQFESGAVRDIAEGKGRCDLLPLDVVAIYIEEDNDTVDWVLMHINAFQENGSMHYLYSALLNFTHKRGWDDCTMLLEVSKHFEEGSKKYGDNNWQKGIPVHCYVDSATRHYIKWLRGDNDEPHDRAVCWNLMCGIWTCKHKPELNEYGKSDEA